MICAQEMPEQVLDIITGGHKQQAWEQDAKSLSTSKKVMVMMVTQFWHTLSLQASLFAA